MKASNAVALIVPTPEICAKLWLMALLQCSTHADLVSFYRGEDYLRLAQCHSPSMDTQGLGGLRVLRCCPYE